MGHQIPKDLKVLYESCLYFQNKNVKDMLIKPSAIIELIIRIDELESKLSSVSTIVQEYRKMYAETNKKIKEIFELSTGN